MKSKKWLSALAGLCLSASVQAADFKLYTESFPPLNMSSNGSAFARNDRVSGFATDIIRTLFSKAGFELSLTMGDWNKALNSAMTDGNSGVYSTFRTEEREDKFKWVGPLYKEDWIIFATSGSDLKIDTLKELHNYKVGSHESDAVTDYLVEKGIKIKPAKNDAVNVVRLKTGQIQLWATSSLTGPYVAANFKVPLKRVLKFSTSNLWLAMSKDTDQAVIDQLNSKLSEMRKAGLIQQMINKYNI